MNVTLYLRSRDLERLREVAERLGFMADRGAALNTPSVSAMLHGIAEGDATVVRLTTPEHHAITRLIEYWRQYEDLEPAKDAALYKLALALERQHATATADNAPGA